MAFQLGDRVRFKQGVSAGANYRGLIGIITGTPVTGMTDERIDVQFGDDKIADISAQVFELAEPEGAPARTGSPGVDPVRWTPFPLRRRCDRCRRVSKPTHRSSGARWSSWFALGERRRSCRARVRADRAVDLELGSSS